MKNHKLLYLITLLYFALGFLNIHFALLAFVCMAIPLFLLFTQKKKVWCQGYCPRAGLYTQCGSLKKSHRKTPLFFVKGAMKWIILGYFVLSLLFIAFSTVRVAIGAMAPLHQIRFLLIFPLGNGMPQLFESAESIPWLTHLSFRMYSMMMTTTFLGLIMAIAYRPRTWCTVCPIATVSDLYLKKS